MKWWLLAILLKNILLCNCQTALTVTRFESGDEVQSSMTSAEYCSAIHGYLDGSQCKCDFRWTFSLESQTCIDYYNVPQFRFSRLGLNADVSVSVVSITTGVDGVSHAIAFAASSSTLPIAQGLGNTPLPTGCTVSSVEFNTYTGWVAQSFNGFSLAEHNSHVYLEVTELPANGAEYFRAQFVRLNITCPSTTGSLMFKFGSASQTFNSSQSDPCAPNRCQNYGSCIRSENGNTFTCSCTDGFTGRFCQFTDHCTSNPCQNNGSCVNGIGTHTCRCTEGFAGRSCEMYLGEIVDRCANGNRNGNGNNGNGNSNSNENRNRVCSSFSIDRMDDGDRVNTPLSSVEYCSSIRAYCPDGSCSYCKCEFRLSYRHDLQRCDDYYNECSLRFSRLTLTVDTGVTTVSFGEDGDGGFEISFDATSFPLPIVQGPADYFIPPGCIVSALAVNRATGWRSVDHRGFRLHNSGHDSFLEVDREPALGVNFFNSEMIRLNITCRGRNLGCLPMKFNGTKNSTYSNDLCDPNPCNNGATCVSSDSSFTCNCAPNYSGLLCDDFDHCSSQPCQNGATCVSSGDSYTCNCPDGFEGMNCGHVTTRCEADSCANGGTCTLNGDTITCNCPEGFTGAVCDEDVDDCVDNLCENGATCSDSGINSYTCTCVNGYTGQYCDINIDDCDPNHCRNGATCIDAVANFSCQCVQGFTGHLCHINIDDCATISCQNGGSCVDGINSFRCECANGFAGERCETNIDDCSPNPCEKGGTCIDGIDNYTCSCAVGFTGITCSIDINDCDPNPCENGGICIDRINSFNCSCMAGFTGTNCSENFDDCNSNPCENGGTCFDRINSFNCSCAEGFTGETCDQNVNDCDPNPCENGGNCTDGIANYTCSCQAGFTGDNCNTAIDYCDPAPCQNGTTCINGDLSFTCNCPEGFTGQLCNEVDDCVGNMCLNGATCVDGTDSYTCSCVDGYTGDSCETDIDDCAGSPCVNGDCTDQVNGYTCSCSSGYTGMNCDEDINECVDNPCNNGVCNNTDGGFVCNCNAGFTGSDCSEGCTGNTYGPDCASNCNCSNGADCSPVTGVCNCTAGYTGVSCGSPICTNPCLYGGTCVEPDMCMCVEPYGGDQGDCSEVVCTAGYCSSGGTCSAGPTGLTCLCPEGFSGQRCERRDRTASGRSNQDESQAGTAVGVSVGLVIALVIAAIITITIIMVYMRHHVKSKQKASNNFEQDAASEGIENPNYSTTHGILNHIKTTADKMDNVYDTVMTNEATVNGDSTANVTGSLKDNSSC